jgi:hypothetical protein
MAKTVLFSALSNGEPKELFYVLEKDKTSRDLTIVINPSRFMRTDEQPVTGELFVQSRYSIHTSDKDPTGNSIVYQRMLDGVPTYRKKNWTDAIKSKSGFIPIFGRLCSVMSDEHFTPKATREVINIGEFNPSYFTLCFLVLVGAPERKYTVFGPHNFYVVDYPFQRFRITLLVSYLSLPSDGRSHTTHYMTYRPEEVPPESAAAFRELTRGHDEEWCNQVYAEIRRDFFEKHIQFDPPPGPRELERLMVGGNILRTLR